VHTYIQQGSKLHSSLLQQFVSQIMSAVTTVAEAVGSAEMEFSANKIRFSNCAPLSARELVV
jgi:hypothetical protein